MPLMRKTYTIYVHRLDEEEKQQVYETPPIEKFNAPIELRSIMASEANGAMRMAKMFYGNWYEFICKCDQTGEEIWHVHPCSI